MNSRNRSLDVLRGLAVLLVICHHYPFVPVMNCGWIGVDLSFVLAVPTAESGDYSGVSVNSDGRWLLAPHWVCNGEKQ